jgi:hypothetical protein
VQPWEEWRPPGLGLMQVLGTLGRDGHQALLDHRLAWDEHEEEYEEIDSPLVVVLLARDHASRFMLEAAPDHPDLGVQVWAPGAEDPPSCGAN